MYKLTIYLLRNKKHSKKVKLRIKTKSVKTEGATPWTYTSLGLIPALSND